MEPDFDIAALFASLGFLELFILILTAFFASVVSGISGYGGGMTLGLLVSPFVPVKLLVPLMSVFVLFSNFSRMYYYRKSIFWKKGIYFAIIGGLVVASTFFLADPIFDAVGHEPAVKALEKEYWKYLAIGGFLPIGKAAVSSFFSGRGQTYPIMWSSLAGMSVSYTNLTLPTKA